MHSLCGDNRKNELQFGWHLAALYSVLYFLTQKGEVLRGM